MSQVVRVWIYFCGETGVSKRFVKLINAILDISSADSGDRSLSKDCLARSLVSELRALFKLGSLESKDGISSEFCSRKIHP